MRPGSIAGGLVLFMVGALVILRTVTHDDQGQNLVDKLLGLGGSPGPTGSLGTPVNVPAQGAAAVLPPSIANRGSRRGSHTKKRNRAAQAAGIG